MTPFDTIALVLSSNVATVLITQFLNRKKEHAGIVKLRNESGQIVLEGELKVTEFYKKQLEAILVKYDSLEKRLDDEVKEHEQCRIKIAALQVQYLDLQRQFTLFKTQVSDKL